MDKKKIILFIVGVVLLAIYLNTKGRGLKITAVEDGNMVALSNGTQVRLIGVSSTKQGKAYLEDHFLNVKVELSDDSSAPFDPNRLSGDEMVYAYLLQTEDGLCINEAMLCDGVAQLVEDSYLKDRLRDFRKAAKKGKEANPDPLTPSPTPVINYAEDDIKLPQYVMPSERRYSNWYVDGDQNISMLQEACDYDLPYTKSFANQLAGRSEGAFNPGQICEIFKYCYNKWRYVNDPSGHEYLARASESIASYLTGDCDDFSILMASCILAIGGDACVNVGVNPNGGHAFTEVDIASFDVNDVLETIQYRFPQYNIESLATRNDGAHLWLNLDWQSAYPGGKYFDCSLSRDAYPCVAGNWSWTKLN